MTVYPKNSISAEKIKHFQAGAFHPFFRAHSHIDSKRREPWLFSEDTKLAIRKAIRIRYSFLPYWYDFRNA